MEKTMRGSGIFLHCNSKNCPLYEKILIGILKKERKDGKGEVKNGQNITF